ncbi:MAG TPA: tRNA preQ1(34) S-adenosylmethionine ribosyltransferase-isomerase QueA [Candidatus Polarisedimenticolia bacterium]|nr:tRNA preQ1(34) S-adenosylmethionine ribosyltransferase-isomerase QueA [Candidatus Polarisedimenticolia bacterium]
MRLEEFDYDLPPDLVAQEPAARRDGSRLLVLDRTREGLHETGFVRLLDHLETGDLLVLNDTRVLPARLIGRKPTGGRVEMLLVSRDPEDREGATWICLISTGRGMRPGVRLSIAPGFEAEIAGEAAGGRMLVRLHAAGRTAEEAIQSHGVMPLPPYIRRDEDDPRSALDRERYQTVFARAAGAIAAPTAGLHFTPELLRAIQERGVALAHLTLHVGPGTFQPVRTARVEDHLLEAEVFRLPVATAGAIDACRERGGRVVAVGTTVTRVLEERVLDGNRVTPGEGSCGLYITPGHRFRVVDALLTNLHLPKSSLLILVSAFAGRDRVMAAYREAVRRRLRFYSYGDAMLIL